MNLPQLVKERLIEISQAYSTIEKIVLYGSRARGDNSEKSDIDIAIFFKDELCSDKHSIIDNIENIDTLLKFDVVFVTNGTSVELLKNIQAEGIIVSKQTKRENFNDAVMRLHEAIVEIKDSKSELMRDGLIQRFEFTTELAWKACREKLIEDGFAEINTPKGVMKESYACGYIDNENIWLEIITDRNETSHIYDKAVAKKIAENIINRYYIEFAKLSKVLT